MDIPLNVGGRVVVEVYPRPEIPDYLDAGWQACSLGWHRHPYPVGEGKTPEAAAADWARQSGISLSSCRVEILDGQRA